MAEFFDAKPLSAEPFDIVTVPDFSGKAKRLFELRTLFFLCFWQEYGGKCRDYPLHLACIGEPPASVRRLAEQFSVNITTHAPFAINQGAFTNKMRGFEVQRQTDHLLLIDTDVLVLNDFSHLTQHYQGVMAAAPDATALVPEKEWHKIYSFLEMPLPTETVLIGHKNPQPALPYYNAGIFSVPWAVPFRELWIECIDKIARYYEARPDESFEDVIHSDQAGFAVAIQQKKRQGTPFKQLANEFHGRWGHLLYGVIPFSDIKLFHAIGLLKIADYKLLASGQFLEIGPRWIYQNLVDQLNVRVRSKGGWKRRRPYNTMQTFRAIVRLHARFQKLYNKYCVPVLK